MNTVNTNRKMERVRDTSEDTAPKAAPKKQDKARGMDLDAYAAAAERNGGKQKFGALASAEPASLQNKIDTAVRRADAEGQAVERLARAAAAANQSLPQINRGAEVITGTVSATATVPDMVGAAMESAVRLDGRAFERAVHDAGEAVSWVVEGSLTNKIAHARAIYRQVEKSSFEYADVNRQYKEALRAQDHAAIAPLSARRDELAQQIKDGVQRLESVVRAVGEEDKRFEAATVHAAEHLALSAVSVGVGAGVGLKPSDAVSPATRVVQDAKHHLSHFGVETATGQVPKRVLGEHD